MTVTLPSPTVPTIKRIPPSGAQCWRLYKYLLSRKTRVEMSDREAARLKSIGLSKRGSAVARAALMSPGLITATITRLSVSPYDHVYAYEVCR
jgi:hypothetical protein